MNALPLKLRSAPDPLPAIAGWVPDPDVTLWLSEARRIMEADPRAEVKFFPLAVSPRDPAVAGAVLTVSPALPALDKILGPRVQRLGEAVPGVLIPVLSRLEPALTPDECRRLFPWSVHFLHPVLGMTGFDVRDALTPSQLLQLPPVEHDGWFAAVPGPPDPPALKQLTLVQEVSLEDLMSGEAGDIASERPDKNPKSHLPGADLAGRAAGAAGSALAGMGAGILRSLGAGGLADKLGQWSQRMWEEVNDRRKKELNRLLDRFDKDLLDALRHAIPLAGAESRRGAAAQPGWQLGARSMNLNSRSYGSGPVDVWHIENDMRLKLERRYREAATREAAAGHYGRAAYIYGELLGDWNMAAQMLEKGGRHREAARIYLDRLRSGPRAAACLENAGLLAEAAALYRDAGMHEKAGDLLLALGQEEAAREEWERALKQLTNSLEQAVMLEHKLKDPDRALAVLAGAWPLGIHAATAFDKHLMLLARLERHEDTAAILDRLERDPRSRLTPVPIMVAALRNIFSHYPDSSINARAAFLGTQFSGEFLAREPNGTSAKQLLALLPNFAPGDRILRRDTNRFSISFNKPEAPLLRRGGKVLHPKEEVQPGARLSTATEWHSLAEYDRGLSAVGVCALPNEKTPFCCSWLERPDGRQIGIGEHVPSLRGPLTAVMLPDGPLTKVLHHRPSHLAFWHHQLRTEIKDVLALGRCGAEFILLCYKETTGLTAEFWDHTGTLRRTRVLDLAPPDIKQSDWFIGGHGDDLWVAGPAVACCINVKVEFQLAQLNGPVTCLAVAPPVLSSQAIVITSGEAFLLTPQGHTNPLETTALYSGANLITPPVAVFTRDGRAVIADSRGGVVYALRKACEKVSDIALPPNTGDIVSAAPYGPAGFALLTSTGKVFLYEG